MSKQPEPASPPAGTERTPIPSARTVTAAVLLIALLYAGREFFVPVALAVLVTALLRPAVRSLERRRMPTAAGATLVLLLTLAVLGGAAWGLSVPLQNWVAKIPKSMAAAQAKLAQLRRPVQQITRVAQQLQNAGAPSDSAAGTRPQPPPTAPSTPVAGALAKALGTTTSLVMGLVEVLLLTWLMLASGDLFHEKLLRLLPRPGDKRLVSRVVGESESVVAGYVAATAMINAGQAVAVGIAVSLIGLSDPLLWAVACFVLEFIPYLGGTLMVGLLSIVSFATYQDVGHILAAPAAYLAISTLQNNVVSPLVYGHHLQLNPVAVLIGVMFWWTLWGVAGAFLAVPVIAVAKVIGDHVPRLRPLGEFLGD